MWGQKTKKLRKELGLSQLECSKITGHSQSSISGYEKTENSNLDYIVKLCNYANKPLWHFFAPEDMTIPDLTPEQQKLNLYFTSLPKNLQQLLLHCINGFIAAYNYGLESASRKMESHNKKNFNNT